MHNKTYHPVQTISVEAIADLPACRFVSYDGDLCAEGDQALGISEISWESGDMASVINLGIAVVECSATVAKGESLTVSTNGMARPALTSEVICARALESVTGAGYVKVVFIP